MKRKEQGERADLYARITDKIVADLENGVRPWVKPWSAANTTGRITRPLRHNGEPYSGLNVLLLWSESVAQGYVSPTWMTFKQALQLNGAVRKGESGTTVIYASRFTKSESDGQGGEVERDIPFLKAYTVFNVAQIDGLPDSYYAPPSKLADPVERLENADRFFRNTGSVVRRGGSQAYYAPVTDHIQMPPFEAFRDAGSHAAVEGHEHIHWTAAADRVGRDLSRYAKDRTDRAREELIAELGAAFLAADLGIVPELEPRPDHVSYLASWLSLLSNDKRAIFQAAAHAQRAVNYLHSLQPVATDQREAA
ncbi:ArdC family protein [Agrobacterium tumefaciens]|uniref:DUF1738 domain-containing protein n=1 Tax=Agrobacterium tumefaciens TaxID=358 RepID=A0AA44FBS7_AGRTU|nr:zincin-like metallopeptidase domain-containing protein [Agrobacterium tumefaciens]NTB87783.1 DUF1738 domain-containing protein [Agrobacterium tumefaciens]NTC31994.1 DUF1738 domain-containing protein [Agrobacterium tumefaciens]